jgi:cyclic peptide transporter
MNDKKRILEIVVILLTVGWIILFPATVGAADAPDMERIEAVVEEVLEKGKIPGAGIVLIKGETHTVVKGYGFADLEARTPVTPETRFELGSCSKSFTALAVLQLEREGLLKLSHTVSQYFPGFTATYRGKTYKITLRQLLNHTSGIPTRASGKIKEGDSADALEVIVRTVSGLELIAEPGRSFQYSNINYDIAGAVIEEASGMKYEDYMIKEVFAPLGMVHTSIGPAAGDYPWAAGYKISFGKPRRFASPVYRANFPAGYVVTNGNDMARWLRVQLDLADTPFQPLIREIQNMGRGKGYWMGWIKRSDDSGILYHGGYNPNFVVFVAFRPGDKTAVAVMANANNTHGVEFLGSRLMQELKGDSGALEKPQEYVYSGGLDNIFSMGSYILWGLLAICIAIILYILIDTLRGVRYFEGLNIKKIGRVIVGLTGTAPLLGGIYLFPAYTVGYTWDLALAWAPGSFPVLVGLLLGFLGLCNLILLLSLILPYKKEESFKNRYLRPLPMILFLGFVSGLAGAASMFLISTSFFNPLPLGYTLYYFGMALFVSVWGQKIVRTRMIVIANNIVYELRMKLITKIFATRFQSFEKIDSGRVYATLNNDTETISNSAGMVVGTVTNLVTAVAAFVYLSAISLLATLSTLLFAVLLGVFYIFVGKKSRVLMEKMRDTQNVFMKLIEGLVKGFREISMHHNKKVEYDADVEASCSEYRSTRVSAVVKFVNANLVSSSMILILLAGICFTFTRVFPEMSLARLISFIMVLLYMIGPITSIMSSFPTFIRIKVSWDRIQNFIKEVPAIEELSHYKEIKGISHKGKTVDCLEATGITFTYQGENGSEPFSVGPIDLKVNKGEILFIVGGNGSGKTTLAKLLTGLYLPEQGKVTIDGNEIGGEDYLGEYFSIIFDDFMLFEKLYNVDIEAKREEIDDYLELLGMKNKVELKDGKFSTINLSSGQRKRLALLQCYLEDCPIYLFDEVAADQDPEFRKFFYRDLLLRMKKEGKVIICITHDDHYFDVADQIIKLDMGKIDDQVVPVLPGKKAMQKVLSNE